MKLYLVQKGCYHDGWQEVGIYSTYQNALEIVNRLLLLPDYIGFEQKEENLWGDMRYNFIGIDGLELDYTDESHFTED